jgi:MtfA peptidase
MPDDIISDLSEESTEWHLRNFAYFKSLSGRGRQRFVERVMDFVRSKEFRAGEGLGGVTDEMKVLISASAVQLTFGLRTFDISHFHTIIVFPRIFYSNMRERYLKGGTTPGGTIFLSWKDFSEGYEHPDDRYNLGLHEMAHALKLDVLEGYGFDQKFGSYLDNWEEIGRHEFERIRDGSPSFLRSYAGTNMHEFFAVCVEHFFEVPLDFHRHLPDIYNHLCVLLNQDPLNAEDDFRLEESFYEEVNTVEGIIPVPRKISMNYKYSGWHWSLNLLMTGPTLGLIIILTLADDTLLETSTLVYAIIAGGCIGLLQWKYFRRSNALSPPLFVMYSFAGFGLNLVALLLLLNYLVPLDKSTETYAIREVKINRQNVESVTVSLQGYAYEEYPFIRTFDKSSVHILAGSDSMKLSLSKGLLGLKVLNSYHFITAD